MYAYMMNAAEQTAVKQFLRYVQTNTSEQFCKDTFPACHDENSSKEQIVRELTAKKYAVVAASLVSPQKNMAPNIAMLCDMLVSDLTNDMLDDEESKLDSDDDKVNNLRREAPEVPECRPQ